MLILLILKILIGKHGRSCQNMILWSLSRDFVLGSLLRIHVLASSVFPVRDNGALLVRDNGEQRVPCATLIAAKGNCEVSAWPLVEQNSRQKISMSKGSSSPRAICLGRCGAQAKWLWNSEAGLMLLLTLTLILLLMMMTLSGRW